MDHRHLCHHPTADDPPLIHLHPTIPSLLVSELPFYIQNPNPPPPPPPSHTNFHDSTTTVSPPPPPPETGWNKYNGGTTLNQGTTSYPQGTSIRWPRQETLTLLESRSRLDHCFREASSSNHKNPLWDEISRIMKEEYGYQRSGKKCKEKFENLYKYYKKTKEGKLGKTDGKHYRFFRQLEALVRNDPPGSTNTHTVGYPSSQSNHSSGNNTTSDYEFQKKDLVATIEESIESHFIKLMVKQEQWCDKILYTLDQKEQERVVIEQQWRTQEVARLDQEYATWASHVAKINTRDESLLNALQNLIRVRSVGPSHKNMNLKGNSKENEGSSDLDRCKDWIEPEVSSLIRIRSNKECKFQEVDQEHEGKLWEEVAFELSLLGYNRSGKVCKETWDKLCVDFNKRKMECEISREVSLGTSYHGNLCNEDFDIRTMEYENPSN